MKEDPNMNKNKFEITWFPEPHQIMFDSHNEQSYLHSVWIGCTSPLLNLPLMLWYHVISPVIRGLWFILNFFILSFINGLSGRMFGAIVAMPVITVHVEQLKALEGLDDPKDKK